MLATLLNFPLEDYPGLNVILNMHRMERTKVKNNLHWKVKAQTRNVHAGTVNITITRYATRPMDWDNYAGGFKFICDAIVKCKIIKDDKPQVVQDLDLKQKKVATLNEERIAILIEDCADLQLWEKLPPKKREVKKK